MDENLGDTKRIGELVGDRGRCLRGGEVLSFTGAYYRTDIANRALKRKG